MNRRKFTQSLGIFVASCLMAVGLKPIIVAKLGVVELNAPNTEMVYDEKMFYGKRTWTKSIFNSANGQWEVVESLEDCDGDYS